MLGLLAAIPRAPPFTDEIDTIVEVCLTHKLMPSSPSASYCSPPSRLHTIRNSLRKRRTAPSSLADALAQGAGDPSGQGKPWHFGYGGNLGTNDIGCFENISRYGLEL